MWPRGWVEVQLYSSMTMALERGEWSAARPGRTLPPGKTRYPFYRRLGGPQGRSGKSRPQRDSIPDRPARSSVAIPTELPVPRHLLIFHVRKRAGQQRDTEGLEFYLHFPTLHHKPLFLKQGSLIHP